MNTSGFSAGDDSVRIPRRTGELFIKPGAPHVRRSGDGMFDAIIITD
jgi:hypothetical protein